MLNQDRSNVVNRTSISREAICAAPGCTNCVSESWDEIGRLCGRCAIEDDLFDRESRWNRVFPVESAEPTQSLRR